MPSIMLGSSHGGYLAHLSAKIAPWAVQSVIDNSGYAKFNWRFIGFGKEVDYQKYPSFGYTFKDFLQINVFDKTHWTMNKFSPNYFSQSRSEIRWVMNSEHLAIQSNYPKPKYIAYHSAFDTQIAPVGDKIELYEELERLGFDSMLYMINRPEHIDGRFIKNMEHGMGMSLKILISKEIPPLLDEFRTKFNENSKQDKKEITYPTSEWLYHFKEENDKLILKCEKV